jgi:small subunit ribosomal protein S1
MKPPIVAIDGPAGSGKSTIARRLARALGLRHVDTGAMYRAVGLLAAERGIDAGDEAALRRLCGEIDIGFADGPEGVRTLVDGRDVSDAIRTAEAGRRASQISAVPAVREVLVAKQRALGAAGGVVMEGRDIGTVVFPDATLKVFLTASPEERARRRAGDLAVQGEATEAARVGVEIAERDARDRERAHSPLRPAAGALIVDTTGASIDAVVARLRAALEAAALESPTQRRYGSSNDSRGGTLRMNPEAKSSAERGDDDFRKLFEESLRAVKPGEVVRGRVVLVTRDQVTVDIGYKSEGQIPIEEFSTRGGASVVKEGDEIDVYFDADEGEGGGIVLSRAKAEQAKVWRDIEAAFAQDGVIEGIITGKVKGGLKVDVGVPAFLPGSHADLRPTRNLDRYISQRSHFAVLKYNRARGNVVVSRRAVMERERAQLKEETLKVLEEGVILEGVVKNITDYGAFVDLGGIDGLLHVTDMSWGRVNRPADVINVGDRVKVVVLKYDAERGRVSLGMKQIMPDPWSSVAERHPVGSRIRGKVVSLADYGAFVELEPGIEGLVHVSEMSWTKRIAHPSKVVNVGDEVDVVVLDVDTANRRISLGLKQAEPNPWEMVRVNHPVGSHIRGTVKNVTDFGVFVGIEEGIDGLVHISDFHWTKKIRHPSEAFKKGDEVEAVVLGIDVDNERISLGIKQLSDDPWTSMNERYPAGRRVRGRITSVADFGVFVEIEEGVEGLIHVSQLSTERVDKPQAMFEPGQEIEAEVTSVETRDRKIALSVKALRRSEEREEIESYLQREREGGRFSFEDILSADLRLDRDEATNGEDSGSDERKNGGE